MPRLNNVKLKVCGLRDNIIDVASLNPDFVGFIFYEKSSRYVGDKLSLEILENIPEEVKKVGVFVNSGSEYITQTMEDFGLDYAQLHGHESLETCKELQESGVKLIKVFSGNKDLDIDELHAYGEYIDYYLFDTRSGAYGGTGESFEWENIESLDLPKPIILSGGISMENIAHLQSIKNSNIKVIDINSRFELRSGFKDTKLIKELQLLMENDVREN